MPLKRDQKPQDGGVGRVVEAQKPTSPPPVAPPVEQAVKNLFPATSQDVPTELFRHNFHNKPLPRTMRQRLHDASAVVAALERLVRTLGSVSNAARHLNTSRPFLSMVLSGARQPSRELSEALGYVPVLMYARAFAGERDAWAATELAESESDAKA